jgi:3'(2'), 5'-bisphosphate nucleotidase
MVVDAPAAGIDDLRTLAERAGAVILQHYGKAEARLKDDSSPVTAADEAAERVIVAGLTALTPEIPIIAEETAARDGIPTQVGRRFWLVDPLDGTKEFLSHNGEFTVNIALVENGVPRMGVVLAPALGVCYFADNRGAFEARSGEPVRPLRARPAPAAGAVAAVSRSHLDDRTRAFLDGLGITQSRGAGSSLKFGLVAAGEADIYPRFGRTMEWDTAAGHAVLRAAGGSVRDESGAELTYGKPGFANPSFIARGADA